MAIPPLDPGTAKSASYRTAARFARTRAGRWLAMNLSTRLDPVLLRLSGGRLSTFPMARMVLLTVPGRRTGRPRTTPLLYFSQGEEVVVIASSFGRDRDPAWYRNVMAHPEVTLRAGGREARYVARETGGEERERLYRLAQEVFPGYADYERRAGAAGRTIPVLALRPVA